MNISHKVLWGIVAVLAVAVVILLAIVFLPRPGGGGVLGGVGSFASAPNTSPDGGLIVVSPKPNSAIGDPVTITGTIGGAWKQGTLMVKLFNGGGLLMGQTQATVNGSGTSTAVSSFTASIPYASLAATGMGSLELSITDASETQPGVVTDFSIPVTFAK